VVGQAGQQPSGVDGHHDDEQRQGDHEMHRREDVDDPSWWAPVQVVDVEDDALQRRPGGWLWQSFVTSTVPCCAPPPKGGRGRWASGEGGPLPLSLGQCDAELGEIAVYLSEQAAVGCVGGRVGPLDKQVGQPLGGVDFQQPGGGLLRVSAFLATALLQIGLGPFGQTHALPVPGPQSLPDQQQRRQQHRQRGSDGGDPRTDWCLQVPPDQVCADAEHGPAGQHRQPGPHLAGGFSAGVTQDAASGDR
jgi:hypothetical protein